MRDTFKRNITYLRLSVTDLCNLRCRYCMPEEGVHKKDHREICSVEELVEIAEAAAACGVEKVRLTGGEPLVRRGILDICRGVAGIGGIRELCMTTNGVLLPQMAGDLRACGVHRLNISLDTLRPERFSHITRIGCLEDVLEGIRAAEQAGFTNTKLNVVLVRGFNDDEIRDFVALTEKRPLEVRFIELMPIGQGTEAGYLPAQAVLDACPGLEPAAPSGVAQRYRLPGARGMVGLIQPMSHRFCASCDRIRVTADGKLKPCLHSDQEIPLRGLHGEALRRAIQAGVEAKPLRHRLVETGHSGACRDMNEIGG